MKRILAAMFCLSILTSISDATASTMTSTISSILIFGDGPLVYVYPTNALVGVPACAGSNGPYYSFLLTRPYAKEYLAGLLAAQARGANVTFFGYGDCRDQSVSETLAYFSVY